ncbi:glutathione S-transferase N-terminal domain-containing protein [Aestuariicella sp. G3-2]|uniref:glutathione S-transferase N-terminal domain-containing protein n=1 Tax=Pseudomaricurvus albidus TaxID=2842452 RepID=UPI001C0C1068|nr:glutathione S-transferase N-terminal domain-containing protein [Aestuariicella albida]MBU3070609.1 glutathione S-transferase N-terminal domain-containing protein [Aestuariicella albida]
MKLLKLLREGLGRLIVLIDWLTRPRKLKRTPDAQKQVEQATQGLSLYQFYACPFCVKTRRAIHRLNLPIEVRDAKPGSQHREELQQGGGAVKVPCLRIEEEGKVRWMYESGDIISYLEQRFA